MFCQFANPSELKRSDVYVYFETKLGYNGKEGFLGVSCLRVHQLEKKSCIRQLTLGRTHLTLQSGIYVNFFDTLTVFHKKSESV